MNKPGFFNSIAFKSIFNMAAILILFTFVVTSIGYRGYTTGMLEQYEEGALLTARSAAHVVDPKRMDEYIASGGTTEEYQTVYSRLESLCNSQNATFVYVIIPDRTDYNHIKFIFSTKNSHSKYELYDFGYVRETTNEEYATKYKNLYDGVSDNELLVRDEGYIETDKHITVMVPLKVKSTGEVVGLLCVQRQLDVLDQNRKAYVKRVVLVLLFMGLLVLFMLGITLEKILLNPITRITEEASRFATENTENPKKLSSEITSKDEIGTLAAAIDHMEAQNTKYVEDLTKVTAQNERISTELMLAKRIQSNILPGTFPAFPDRTEFDIFASMEPARSVGGDFYDFSMIDDDHLYMAIADVSGKGVPAALFMMAAKSILANNASMNLKPSQILEVTNAAACNRNTEEMFVTVWVGILELSTGKLTAANAGHEYPIIMNEEGKFELFKDPHGFVLGGMEGMKYTDYEIDMKPGDKIFLFTDGVTEACNKNKELFGVNRLLKVLNNNAEDDTQGIIKSVRSSIEQFDKDVEQFDDITMLCLEYIGKCN